MQRALFFVLFPVISVVFGIKYNLSRAEFPAPSRYRIDAVKAEKQEVIALYCVQSYTAKRIDQR